MVNRYQVKRNSFGGEAVARINYVMINSSVISNYIWLENKVQEKNNLPVID